MVPIAEETELGCLDSEEDGKDGETEAASVRCSLTPRRMGPIQISGVCG